MPPTSPSKQSNGLASDGPHSEESGESGEITEIAEIAVVALSDVRLHFEQTQQLTNGLWLALANVVAMQAAPKTDGAC